MVMHEIGTLTLAYLRACRANNSVMQLAFCFAGMQASIGSVIISQQRQLTGLPADGSARNDNSRRFSFSFGTEVFGWEKALNKDISL